MEKLVIMRRLLPILLSLGLVSGQRSELKYLVVAPAILPFPSNQTTCAYVISSVNATLVITLRVNRTSVNTVHHISSGDSKLYCSQLQVPPPINGVEEIAAVYVDITSDKIKKLWESKSVMIRTMRNGIFAETDKAIYQPGEKIIMKAVNFNQDLIAINENFTNITLTDNQHNILRKWQNVQPNSGILTLTYNLSPNAPVGLYTFTVNKSGSVASVTVTVEKSVLPKFEVTINAPDEVTIEQKNFFMNLCGKYTYGKPTRGLMIGKMCRNATFTSDNLCKPIDGKTDVNGCYSVQVDTGYFRLKKDGYKNYIEVKFSLEEEGTGVEIKAIKYISITDILAKADFKEPRAAYKPGLDYQGFMTLTGPDGQPIADKDIELYVNGEKRKETYKTGMAKFTIESASLNGDVINLKAQYVPKQPVTDPTDPDEVQPVYENGYATLIRSYTKTKSQVKIRSDHYILPCNTKVNLGADYYLDPSEYTKKTIDFHYLIFTAGKIVSYSTKRHTISKNGGQRSLFAFSFTVTSKMSPAATIIIYTGLENGNLIADSIKIPVSSCFPNTVSLNFSKEQSLPGSNVSLQIRAYPNSLCNVRAVDKSVELLKSESHRPEDTVNEFLKKWDINSYPTVIEELQKCPNGSSPKFEESSQQPDSYSFFENSEMKVLSNFMIRKPPNCESQTPSSNSHDLSSNSFVAFSAGAGVSLPSPKKTRKIFPSTWLMNTVPIGPTGILNYPLKTPDTITEWLADAFCTATIGLGFSPRTHLQVFKPFLLHFTIPYSVKQGETLVLKAIVLNFLDRCIKVKATLYQNKDFQTEPCENCVYSACLCSDPTHTFTWTITPLKMGVINITIGAEALNTSDLCDGKKPIVPTEEQSDVVQRHLIVEPNGMPMENTRTWLICAFESETIPLALPKNVVRGSASAQVAVTGDIMGMPLSHLDNLVKLPMGCGEQNMIIFAPVISAYNYLSTTGQLTDEIVEKAREYIEKGFQNELTFKHKDGSYSAFGDRDPSGSTWLTAFVALYFKMGQELNLVDIDDSHITAALEWLKGQQESNGCFKSVGQIIHKELQGGEDSQLSLTAYVTSVFVQIGNSAYDEVIEKAKQCLENCTQPQSSTYTKAQCAYTYTLLGDKEKRTQLLQQLDKVAIKNVSKTHWSINSDLPKDDPLWSKPNSADVETTAYVVLAWVSDSEHSKSDLGAAVPAIRWLTSQQNANGGFDSTQDTVAGIHALSIFGSLTHVDESMPTITITNDKGFNRNVTINPMKLTEVQTVVLPDIPANYTVEAMESGCAYIQITQGYNILNPEPEGAEGAFTLDFNITSLRCPPQQLPLFHMDVSFRLANSTKYSNMVLLIVQYLSGYVITEKSISELLTYQVVKRVENNQANITIYLEEVTSTLTKLPIEMEERFEVTHLRPAIISINDYYVTSRHAETIYFNPCA